MGTDEGSASLGRKGGIPLAGKKTQSGIRKNTKKSHQGERGSFPTQEDTHNSS